MDDCVGAAVEQISEGVRATVDASRKGKLSQYQSWEDLQRTDLVAAHFDHVLRTYEEERGLTEIFLRYRGDPSVLGETLQRLEDEAHRKVLEDMWDVGKRLGLQAHHYEDVVLHCEFVLGMLQRATELLLSGRYASRKQLVWKLARMTQATMIAEVSLATGALRGKSST